MTKSRGIGKGWRKLRPDKTRPLFIIEFAGYGTPCYLWQRSISYKGYAHWSRSTHAEYGKLGHRVMYQMANGPIPKGMVLDHLCRNRHCVRPDHLEVVTPAQNIRRGKPAKITLEIAEKIRAEHAAGISYSVIARKYGIHHTHVYAIKNRKNWR